MTWALIAQSAIDGPCGGILAASADIETHIIAEDSTMGLFIFPDSWIDPGFYLWEGTMEAALTGEGGKHTVVAPEDVQRWIDRSGEEA